MPSLHPLLYERPPNKALNVVLAFVHPDRVQVLFPASWMSSDAKPPLCSRLLVKLTGG